MKVLAQIAKIETTYQYDIEDPTPELMYYALTTGQSVPREAPILIQRISVVVDSTKLDRPKVLVTFTMHHTDTDAQTCVLRDNAWRPAWLQEWINESVYDATPEPALAV